MIHRLIALFAALLCVPLSACASQHVAAAAPARQGMVSAADPRAAAAGAEILREGGSAADAAIAMMLALNVVEPQSSGIGGGGFLVHHDAKSGGVDTFDGREEAPMAADPRWFYVDDKPLGRGAAIPGGRSVGVPGNLRMMALVHREHGKLPWARLFEPAIRLAEGGFAITPRLNATLTRFSGRMGPWAQDYFFQPDGRPKPVGTILRNPEQAALFGQIAARGPDYFYVGPPAQTLVATVNGAARNPSKMAAGDLASYEAKERAPVCGSYRAYRVCGMGPPSSGGITVLMILKQLERFDMATLGKDSPVAWHLFAESSRLAYADRDMYMADADHIDVPVKGLLDPAYLAGRSALISTERAIATAEPGTPPGAPRRARAPASQEQGTSSMVAADRDGNVAKVTSTIESVFGSQLTMNGIFLNNELTDFEIVPEEDGYLVANRVEPGKRPRSSMAPTIVYNPDGSVRIAIGAAGGTTIIAQVAKALVAVLDWKLPAQDAIALGLIFAPGPVIAEQGTELERMVPALQALGDRVVVAPLGLKANAIERVNGRWVGAADPRSEGVAMNEDGTAFDIVRVSDQPNRPPE